MLIVAAAFSAVKVKASAPDVPLTVREVSLLSEIRPERPEETCAKVAKTENDLTCDID